MDAGSVRRSLDALRAPLADALAVELGELDRRILRLWTGLVVAGIGVGLVTAVTASRPLGLASAAISAVFAAFFLGAEALSRRGRFPRALPLVVAVVEATIPWAFSLVIGLVQGPIYAMASWVPPMLFSALIVAQTARFRVVAPLVVGATGAIAHLLLYLFVVRPRLPVDPPLFAQGTLQITRAMSLLAAGALGTVVGLATRRVIGRAEREVRAQDLFGKYRLVRHLASGGMGLVFEALYCPEGGFSRRVAVKRIHPHLAELETFVSAFRAEAELCAHLTHPNIVQVLDFGRVGQTYFLAMELVEGAPLSAIVRRQVRAREGLPEGVVARIGACLLAGLAHAHGGARDEEGKALHVVHRDLCPANVLLSAHGDVKISDFGVARALGDAAQGHTRSLEGHAPYMAPEQVRCLPFDERVDLFSVGVVLWELLVGQYLFRQSTEHQTLLAVIEATVPPPSLSRAVDPAWDAFFARALAREPDDRFPTADAMRAALEAIPGARATDDDLAALVAEAQTKPAQAEEPEAPTTRDT